MNETHLTDEEIQQYVLDRETADAGMAHHIDSCVQCKEKAETYRLLFTGLNKQPGERFNFSVADLVMQQLPVPAPAAKTEKENVLIYVIITAGATIVGFAIYYFRKYMTGLFESIAPVFIYLVLTAFTTLSIFLVADIYKRYKKKIHTLDLHRG